MLTSRLLSRCQHLHFGAELFLPLPPLPPASAPRLRMRVPSPGLEPRRYEFGSRTTAEGRLCARLGTNLSRPLSRGMAPRPSRYGQTDGGRMVDVAGGGKCAGGLKCQAPRHGLHPLPGHGLHFAVQSGEGCREGAAIEPRPASAGLTRLELSAKASWGTGAARVDWRRSADRVRAAGSNGTTPRLARRCARRRPPGRTALR